MIIKILGKGCANCKRLQNMTEEAVKEMNVSADIQKVEDIQKIMSYGIMSTPALVIDEKVKVLGRVPGKDEIKKMIGEMM